jgi:hypothetical protein
MGDPVYVLDLPIFHINLNKFNQISLETFKYLSDQFMYHVVMRFIVQFIYSVFLVSDLQPL